jgi:uncharacterized protein
MMALDSRDIRLVQKTREHPRPLLFATLCGDHLYGFPSRDSAAEIRGAHVLPVPELLHLKPGLETIELSNRDSRKPDNMEYDIVTHDLRKFIGLMLKKNGYILEQLYSPLVVHSTKEHEELKFLGKGCITRHHNHHYRGFAETQWQLFEKQRPRQVKPLLYVYRILLTGIQLMRTGVVESNLLDLNLDFKLPYLKELVSRKLAGAEHSILPDADLALHRSEYARLVRELETAHEASSLPEAPSTRDALDDFQVRVRLEGYFGESLGGKK